jgi:Tfp pilus assembly protein PilW
MIALAVALVCLLVAVAAVLVGLYRWTRQRRTETTRLEENSRVVFSFVIVACTTRSEQVSIPPLC